ncbi:ATP phosphoribosyltransferase regulatory subunit [Alicyclobacillus cycloheptanicus]|nr:ATP phosphoribosyltransferase regulatory subunit [Alicyclobacillus cycloheptanicus]WDM00057.1 ATP phosphoribosyltransferase regulatory subunit [Alicyclobacillus cycloheptanicus]
MRDLYPQHARMRRKVENQLLEFFAEQAFDMVSSGAFEYVETLSRGRVAEGSARFVQWFDTDGKAVALRPDMTPSIARMAAPLLANGRQEIRWCYAERVYHRTTDPASLSWASGRAAESTQVGVEWIGAAGTEADAALLQLCQNGLDRLGVPDWHMVASHANIAQALLTSLGIAPADVQSLLDTLTRGDYVAFQDETERMGIKLDVLQVFARCNPYEPSSFPDWSAEVDSASFSAAKQAWRELTAVAHALQAKGLAHRVSFDLALHRDVSYYTGLVFEVYSPGVGAPVAVGGRYDDLLAQFGAPAPAIGFTFEVERVLAVLTEGAWLHGDGEGSTC